MGLWLRVCDVVESPYTSTHTGRILLRRVALGLWSYDRNSIPHDFRKLFSIGIFVNALGVSHATSYRGLPGPHVDDLCH